MKRIVLPMLLLSALAGCANNTDNTDNTSTTSVPTDAIYEQRARLAHIWPGYDPVERGIGYYASDSGLITLVKDSEEVPPGFTAQGTGVWLSKQPYVDLRSSFYIERPIGELSATLVRVSPQQDNYSRRLFHEDFHGYQGTAFSRAGSVSTLHRFDYGGLPREKLVAAIRQERQLLTRALRADTKVQRDEFLMRYASLRLWREAQMPPSSVHVERGIETWEGTANWLGYRADHLTYGRADESLEDDFVELLEHNYEEMSGDLTMRLMTVRVYAKGTVLSELLTRMVGSQWQAQVADDAQLFSLMLDLYDWPRERLTTLATQIIESREFKQAVTDASTIQWPLAEEELLAQIKQRHGWQLTLTLPQHEARFSVSGGTLMPLENGAILLDPAEQVDLEGAQMSVQINNLSVISFLGAGFNSTDSSHGDSEPSPSLQVFLNGLPEGIECPEQQMGCEGSVQQFSMPSFSLQSETPVRYRLERLN